MIGKEILDKFFFIYIICNKKIEDKKAKRNKKTNNNVKSVDRVL